MERPRNRSPPTECSGILAAIIFALLPLRTFGTLPLGTVVTLRSIPHASCTGPTCVEDTMMFIVQGTNANSSACVHYLETYGPVMSIELDTETCSAGLSAVTTCNVTVYDKTVRPPSPWPAELSLDNAVPRRALWHTADSAHATIFPSC